MAVLSESAVAVLDLLLWPVEVFVFVIWIIAAALVWAIGVVVRLAVRAPHALRAAAPGIGPRDRIVMQ
ncbi:MAG TPA: hypothetical protein VN241_00475 [Microbacterium sp.]|nr:hypothetical protein [Microbacterium sp.]